MHPVEQINVLKIRITNNGDIPITSSDFGENPIRIELKNCKNLFNHEITNSKPDHLKVPLEINDNVISIFPMLINPKDYFDIQITFDGKNRLFRLYARIEGVNEVNHLSTSEPIDNIFFSTESFLKIWTMLGIGFVTILIISNITNFFPMLMSAVAGFLISIVLFVKTLSEKLSRKARDILKKDK